MKLLLPIACATALSCALPAWACTPEEATQKREELAGLVTQLTEQNPQKAKEINDELQGMELGTASKDLPDKCQLIDKRIKELKEAEKRLNRGRLCWPFAGARSTGITQPSISVIILWEQACPRRNQQRY